MRPRSKWSDRAAPVRPQGNRRRGPAPVRPQGRRCDRATSDGPQGHRYRDTDHCRGVHDRERGNRNAPVRPHRGWCPGSDDRCAHRRPGTLTTVRGCQGCPGVLGEAGPRGMGRSHRAMRHGGPCVWGEDHRGHDDGRAAYCDLETNPGSRACFPRLDLWVFSHLRSVGQFDSELEHSPRFSSLLSAVSRAGNQGFRPFASRSG